MKIILSRKGFDSGSGRVPSPIFPDGKMLSLPIPAKQSIITYDEIHWNNSTLGKVVSDLTNGRIQPVYRAHLDPDINRISLKRGKLWKPIFGQVGAAQGHLIKQNITEGDLFVFFGLFRNVRTESGKYIYEPFSKKEHVIWGWLQIDKIIDVKTCDQSKLKWAMYHPHFNRMEEKRNTVYIAKEYLDLPGLNKKISGAGVFEKYSEVRQLTNPDGEKLSEWRLPRWFYPEKNKKIMTYHVDRKRWSRDNQYSYLKTVGRGQEFVLDGSDYPESYSWLKKLIIENH